MSQDILDFDAADARALVPKKVIDLKELGEIVAAIKKCAANISPTNDFPSLGIEPRSFISELVIEHLRRRGFKVSNDPPYGWYVSFGKSPDDWGSDK